MVKLRSFSKSEDAHLAAALLGSEGIDVTVNDESSFGGNLLGATANAITIEVEESDFELAIQILAENGEDQVVETKSVDLAEAPIRTWYFDALVIGELILIGLGYVWPDLLYDKPPENIQNYLDGMVSIDLWLIADGVSAAYLILMLTASVLIFFRMKIGRVLYLGVLVWAFITMFCYPPIIETGIGTGLYFIQTMFTGAISVMMFLQPVSSEFRKRLTE